MKALLVVLLILALGGTGLAAPGPAATLAMDDAARQLFQRGAAQYEAGAYAQAIDAFERGQRLDPHPDFLYALAQAYRKLGDCSRAISLYQAFLATHPPDEEAARARANLERCPLSPPAAPPPPPVTEHGGSPWYADVTGAVLTGTALIGLGVGTTYLVVGDRHIRDANRIDLLGDRQRLEDLGVHDRQIGTWCLVAGGALMAGAIIRYALHRQADHTTDRTVRVESQRSGIVVSWGGPL